MSSLRARLAEAMGGPPASAAAAWGQPRLMTKVLKDVRSSFGEEGGASPTQHVLQTALRGFAERREVASFTELKHVCYGVTVPLAVEGWRIIDREPLFDRLLKLVDSRKGQDKQFRRCYQGLLSGYFGFDRHLDGSVAATPNWARLRGFLGDRLNPVRQRADGRGLIPDWLRTLSAHDNLLTEDPCTRYAMDLRAGDTDGLRELCATLGIQSTSWVWEDALMAWVRAVCDQADEGFQNELPGVLGLVNGESAFHVARQLSTKATALSVSRYRRSSSHPEHADLRDASIRWIGNPWADRIAWDAHVRDEPARTMVDGWLKRRLIRDFFQLLAHDGAADLRRLDYWLKYEPEISDMWFVLGDHARRDPRQEFVDVRTRMTGRDRRLIGRPEDNAFVMRIGPLLVIEFGLTGSACYVFDAGDFKTDMSTRDLSIAALKQRVHETRLRHQGPWEATFDAHIRQRLRSKPRPKPASGSSLAGSGPAISQVPKTSPDVWAAAQPRKVLSESDIAVICRKATQFLCTWDDNRSRGGAFWVLAPERGKSPPLDALLDWYGFRHVAGKGYWFKDQF